MKAHSRIWKKLSFSILLLFFCLSFSVLSQSTWYKYPGNPVFEFGKNGEWDQNKIAHVVLVENDQYHMWYKGWTSEPKAFMGIGYATSPDGIHWRKYEGNPLDFKFEDEDWAWTYYSFDILKKDTMYLMWYTGFDKKDSTGCVGYAWSHNGFNWTKYPEPVMLPGNDDAWDGANIFDFKVIFDGNLYHAWYNAYGIIYPAPLRIGYATSYDGIIWQKHATNPVLDCGDPGSWEDVAVGIHSVNYNGAYYEMWYDGFDLINTQIGYASSVDGIHWIKFSENPVLKIGELGSWDTWIARIPVVVSQDSIYRMWYYGHNNARGCIGYATTSADESMAWDTATINKAQKIIKVQVFNRTEFINVDSLSEILPGLSDTELIDALNKLALAYSLNNGMKCSRYAERAIELAKKENYPAGKAMALYSIGNSQYVMDNYSDALANQLSALWLFDSLNMQFELANLLSQIAGIHSYTGSHDLACRYYEQALEVFERLSDTGFIIHSLIYLGNSNLDFGDTASAIKAFQRRLSLVKASGDKWKEAESYEDLGRCYSAHKLDSALYYFNEANKIWRTRIAMINQGYTFLITAEAYFSAGPEYYDKAEEYFFKSLNWIQRQRKIRTLFGIAELYFNIGRYKNAGEFLDISLHDCQNYLSRQNHQMFTYLNDKMEYEKFLKAYMEKIYHLYYRLDTTLNDDRSALKHHLLATQWRDNISNDQNRNKMDMMQGNFDAEINRNKIFILEKENKIQNLTLKKSRIFLFGLGTLVLTIILGAIIYIRQRKIRAQHAIELEQIKSEKLVELDHLKSRFFANISHEFRTPLTLILGPLDNLLSKASDNADIKELNIAKKYAKRLQNLINQLLTLSKFESGKMKLRASETDIVKLVRTTIQSFESLAKQRNIKIQFTSESKEIRAFIDQEKFGQVLNNLLSNAFKFTGDGGRIEVGVHSQQYTVQGLSDGKAGSLSARDSVLNEDWRLKTEDLNSQWVGITISDTGRGISPNHLPHIFDRLYQVEEENSYYEGTGIGLALTKELVELHHGNITVLSEPGKGSIFTILLPLGNDHLKPEEIIVEKPDERSSIPLHDVTPDNEVEDPFYGESIVDNNKDQSILLIVDDNVDMRSYIRSYFENEYNIIEAVNGAEGYDVSTQHIPDIIISDVMMPTMDGNEFCRKIKADERTSHIPVILLTARASRESRMEGLETGADDFISKPFNGEELKLRVKNLVKHQLRIRKLLEQKIQKSKSIVQIDFADSSITSSDEQFLQKVIEIVKEHYTDPQFNINKLGQDIGLGRIQLNRKIKALTGQTTVSFIRAFRLNRAAELIKKESATVAEIAYDVGFSSPSYFSECFRLYFGSLPSDFNKKE